MADIKSSSVVCFFSKKLVNSTAPLAPEGPSEEERQANRYQAAVYITDANGEISWATLETVNGYSFTPMAAAKAAQRVINGEIKSGFQTPAGLFGNGFVTSIEDTSIRFYN